MGSWDTCWARTKRDGLPKGRQDARRRTLSWLVARPGDEGHPHTWNGAVCGYGGGREVANATSRGATYKLSGFKAMDLLM
jgi:hypothetical protein